MFAQTVTWMLGRLSQIVETLFSGLLTLPKSRRHLLVALNTTALLTVCYYYFGTRDVGFFRSDLVS